jgi:hypothetical protein
MRHILAIEQPTSSNDRYLPLKGGRIAIVDADDYERFGQFNYGVNNCVSTWGNLRVKEPLFALARLL